MVTGVSGSPRRARLRRMPAPLIHDAPLPYVDVLPRRPVDAVELAVIHCTELPDLATAREYGERVLHASGAGNSGHYYVDRDGSLHQYVPLDRIAHWNRMYGPRGFQQYQCVIPEAFGIRRNFPSGE